MKQMKGRLRRLVGGRDIARHSFTRITMSPDDTKILPEYPIHAVDYVSGTVFLARSSVFKEIGLLDEEYFLTAKLRISASA